MPIENYYEAMYGANPIKQLEYPIPSTPFRHPDMFNSLTGDVYEIEPITKVKTGAIQVNGYIIDLNTAADAKLLTGNHPLYGKYNWNKVEFHTGLGLDWPGKFRQSPLSFAFPAVDLVADYVGEGVVAYWIEPNALAPVILGKLIAGMVPNKKILRPRNWIPSQRPYQPAYAIDFGTACGVVLIVAGGTILTATIVEDATGLGIVDDIITVPGGLLLVDYGLKLAAFAPVP